MFNSLTYGIHVFTNVHFNLSSTKISHTIGLALLCFLVLPNLDSVKGLLVTSSFGLGATPPPLASMYNMFLEYSPTSPLASIF